MGNCGVRSKPQVSLPSPIKTNPATINSLRLKLLELKQAEKVPVLTIAKSHIYQRRLVRLETMAESWEAPSPMGKS